MRKEDERLTADGSGMRQTGKVGETPEKLEIPEMPDLPPAFLERMKGQLGSEEAYHAFIKTYFLPTRRGLRVNTLKITKAEFEEISPFLLTPVPWAKNGFYVTDEKIGRHPYHFAGLYYSQEPSAMSVAELLEVKSGERVLDLCAAPGGKSTQIAQELGGKGILVCNEIIGNRAKILSQNIERLGVKNAVVVNATPAALAQKFPRYFDKILVDAPCSGEGMFKKNEKEAVESWSEENVTFCATRQREILSYAQQMLKAGGRLVYSTCTFAPQEDEEQVATFLQDYPAFALLQEKKLYPHEVEGEGHYYAVLEKRADVDDQENGRTELPLQSSNLSKKDREALEKFGRETLGRNLDGVLYRAGDTLYLLPDGAFTVEKLPLLRAGVRVGEYIKERTGERFEPNHALAMALKVDEVKRVVRLDEGAAERYLRGETVAADVENGWCLVTVHGYSLGWGKASNGTVKNHYPKGLRLVK